MKLRLALIVLLLIAALTVSGCCCCVCPGHRGYYSLPLIKHNKAITPLKVTATTVPIKGYVQK